MVEKNPYGLPQLQPLLVEHGNARATHLLVCQVAISSLKERQLDMNLGNGKDLLGGGKNARKTSVAWKLLMLVAIGACGIYICMIGVDQKLSYHQHSDQATIYRELSQHDNFSCPELFLNSDFQQHYPQPITFQREECGCTPVHYFAILSMQRSGSGWFETLLNNHPNVSSHGEVFAVPRRRENFSTIVGTLNSIYNLDWLNSASKNECTSAVGLKWMLNQGAMEYHREIASYFNEKGVSVIVLLRRNSLKRLVSTLANAYDKKEKLLNGTHKSHVHSKEEANTLAEFKPTIDVKHLPSNLQRIKEISRDVLRLFNGTRLMLLYYEDLVKNPMEMERVQKFLGVEHRNLQSEQVKIHTRPLKEQIQNWEEVLKRLRGTEYEKFLLDNDYV